MSQANYRLSYKGGGTIILLQNEGTTGGAHISDQAPLYVSRTAISSRLLATWRLLLSHGE